MHKFFGKNCKHQTVTNWIKKAGLKRKFIHLLKKRNQRKVWIADEKNMVRITAFEVGAGKTVDLRKVIDKIVCTKPWLYSWGFFIHRRAGHVSRHKACSEQVLNLSI